jgi:hypothetical protein
LHLTCNQPPQFRFQPRLRGLVTRRFYDRRLKHRLRSRRSSRHSSPFLTCVRSRQTHSHHWSFGPPSHLQPSESPSTPKSGLCTSSARNNTSAITYRKVAAEFPSLRLDRAFGWHNFEVDAKVLYTAQQRAKATAGRSRPKSRPRWLSETR